MSEPTLRELAERRGLLIGAACSPALLKSDLAYRTTLAREFNCIVAENCMKSAYLQPERAWFDFAAADQLIAFAREHALHVRGHTLVWHNQLPAWLAQGTYSKTAALDILREHIFTVLDHFDGAVFCWDVVNEGLADAGGWRKDSPWYRMIGSEYLKYAFLWAHEADPNVRLFYNDYGLEQPGAKADACHQMLRDLLRAGIPVQGVGFQGHLGLEHRLDPPACIANLRRFTELGLAIHFTEMDIGIRKPITDALRQEQAREYASRVRIALSSPAVSALLFWGFTDRYSWIPGFTQGASDEPLLFDADYRPKPAHAAVLAALRDAPAGA